MKHHKERIANFVETLQEYRFTKTIDKIGEYSPDADLYFRPIGGNRYIVFNHYGKKLKVESQGIDCWISIYNSPNEIGVMRASEIETARLTFHIDRDWELITKYL